MEPNGGNDQFQYNQQMPTEELAATSVPLKHQEETTGMQWKASEFIDHQKSIGWFAPLIIVVGIIAAIIYLFSKDVLATFVILLAGISFGTYAHKKPRTLTYSLLPTSINIGAKSYSYDDFRSFSIIQEGPLFSIFLEPVKRFVPPINIYFAPEDGEQIFDILARYMPHLERELDPLENFMRKIRF